MNRTFLLAVAALGSLAMLLGAYGFQHIGGLAPCKMCLWQRWPHAVAVGIGLLIALTGERSLGWFGALAAATTGAIGVYHAGVEWRWWEGPSSCTGSGTDLGAMSGADLLAMDTPVALVLCDEIVWQFLGLSMAGWNAVISFGLAALWIIGSQRRSS